MWRVDKKERRRVLDGFFHENFANSWTHFSTENGAVLFNDPCLCTGNVCEGFAKDFRVVFVDIRNNRSGSRMNDVRGIESSPTTGFKNAPGHSLFGKRVQSNRCREFKER